MTTTGASVAPSTEGGPLRPLDLATIRADTPFVLFGARDADPSGALLTEARRLVSAHDFPTLFDRDDLVAVLSSPDLHRATVTLPDGPPQSRYRLLVPEYERWEADAEPSQLFYGPDPRLRLVFAEAVEINVARGSSPVTT